MCPFCRQRAPLVYRGVVPFCTGCGRVRAPFSGASVNLAGQPSKVGGAVTRVIGWMVLVIGLVFALFAGLLAGAVATVATGFAFGVPLALLFGIFGMLLLRGGQKLQSAGENVQRVTREQAAFAVASQQGGVVSIPAVAHALNITETEADALLTHMAKTDSDRVAMDVDDEGAIYFRMSEIPGMHKRVAMNEPRVRVDERAERETRGEKRDIGHDIEDVVIAIRQGLR
jgi:hypothetical protein